MKTREQIHRDGYIRTCICFPLCLRRLDAASATPIDTIAMVNLESFIHFYAFTFRRSLELQNGIGNEISASGDNVIHQWLHLRLGELTRKNGKA